MAGNQLLAPALRHATHETKDNLRPFAFNLAHEVLHLADGLLLRLIAHTACIQEDDIRYLLGGCERISFGDKLSGDSFRVALVHLTAISFNENAGHFAAR